MTEFELNTSQEVRNYLANANNEIFFEITNSDDSFYTIGAGTYNHKLLVTIFSKARYTNEEPLLSSDISIKACYDYYCTNEVGTVSFTYQLKTVDLVNNDALEFTHEDLTGSQQQTINMPLGVETLNVAASSASISLLSGDNDWLTSSVSFSSTAANIELNYELPDCGRYSAMLSLDLELHNGANIQSRIPVVVQNNSVSPVIQRVAPVVHYQNQPIEFTARGCGLDKLDLSSDTFAGLEVESITKRNELEVEIKAKAVADLGEVQVSLNNQGVHSLMIKAVNNVQNQMLDSGAEIVLFDEHNQRLLLQAWKNTGYVWALYEFKDGLWQRDTNFDRDELNKVHSYEVSADGAYYYAMQRLEFKVIDSSTYQVVDTLTNPLLLGISQKGLSEMIDGFLLYIKDGSDRKIQFNLSGTDNVAQIGSSLGNLTNVMRSRDRSSFVYSARQSTCCDNVVAEIYKTQDGQFLAEDERESRLPDGSKIIAISQNGRYLLNRHSGLQLYNDSFEKLKEFDESIVHKDQTYTSLKGTINHDASKIYILYELDHEDYRQKEKIIVEYDINKVSNYELTQVKVLKTDASLNNASIWSLEIMPGGSSIFIGAFSTSQILPLE